MGSYVDVSAEDDEVTSQLIEAAKVALANRYGWQADGPLRFHQTDPFTDLYSGRRLVRVGVSYIATENP